MNLASREPYISYERKVLDEIEEIKKRINIVEFIGSYVPLKKAGVNYKGLCPFHKEDTPSFMVSEEKNIWHCFGCGEGGDIFTFVEKMEGLEFYDALKFLAEKAGVKLKRQNIKVGQEKVKLSDINEAAANFYHQVLLHPKAGKRALAYLKKRGLTLQTIKNFQIGYAPNTWESTFKALSIKKHFKPEDIERAGLVIRSNNSRAKSSYYDRFRGRIMFPIRNVAATCVGFSGRLLEDDPEAAKYVNTPETPIFHKSEVIFGIDRARQTIRQKNFVIIVEGQMDVVSAHQAGFEFMVATSGTALTPQHIEFLKKYTENIAFCFDTDSAGTAAAKRAIDVANGAGVNAKLVILPKGEDPDSLIKKDKKKFVEALKNAKNAMDFYFDKAFEGKTEITLDEKRKISSELLPQIKKIADPIIKGEYIKKLADRLNTSEDFLLEALTKIEDEKKFPESQAKSDESFQENLEERLLALMILFPKIAQKHRKSFSEDSILTSGYQDLYKKLKKLYNTKEGEKLIDFKKNLPAQFSKRLDLVILKIQDEMADLEKEEIWQEIGLLLNRIRSDKLENTKEDFAIKIKKAEAEGDREKVKKLIKEFQTKIIDTGERNV